MTSPIPPIPAPLRLHSARVRPEWVDYNGHMSEWCYLLVFGDSADAFFRLVGVDEGYRAGGHSLYTVETHLHHLGEAALADDLALTLQVLDVDAKRLHIYHELRRDGIDERRNADSGALLATAEQLLVHVDTVAARACAMPSDLLSRLQAIGRAHAACPRPSAVGHVMGIRR